MKSDAYRQIPARQKYAIHSSHHAVDGNDRRKKPSCWFDLFVKKEKNGSTDDVTTTASLARKISSSCGMRCRLVGK